MVVTATTLAAAVVITSSGEPRTRPARPAVVRAAQVAPRANDSSPSPAPAGTRVAVPSSSGSQLRTLSAPRPLLRARVRVRGQLLDTYGRGGELDLRLFPYWDRSGDQAAAAPPLDVDARAQGDRASFLALDGDDIESEIELAGRELDLLGASCTATSGGAFERDVTAILLASRELPDGFLLTVRHTHFRAVNTWIPLSEHGRALDSDDLAEEREIDLDTRIVLEPISFVHGSVRCVGGDCDVRLEAWSLNGERLAGMGATTSLAAGDDAFELALAPRARYAIVAMADGYLPQTVIVTLGGQLDAWIAPIVLDHGVRFSGTIDLARHTLGRSTWLYLSRGGALLGSDVFGRSGLVWDGRALVPEHSAVLVSEDGRFEFDGLVPGAHELRFGIDRDSWTEMDPRLDVWAPSEGAHIVPPLTRVSLALEQPGSACAHRRLSITGVGRSAGVAELETDAGGRVDLWLFPGEPYVVRVPQPSAPDWSYGKVVPWHGSSVVERIVMASARGAR